MSETLGDNATLQNAPTTPSALQFDAAYNRAAALRAEERGQRVMPSTELTAGALAQLYALEQV